MGLLITNGEFTAFIDKHFCPSCAAKPVHVITTKSNAGGVSFVNTVRKEGKPIKRKGPFECFVYSYPSEFIHSPLLPLLHFLPFVARRSGVLRT